MTRNYHEVGDLFEPHILPLGYMVFWYTSCESLVRTLLAACTADWQTLRPYAAAVDRVEFTLERAATDVEIEAYNAIENGMDNHVRHFSADSAFELITDAGHLSEKPELLERIKGCFLRFSEEREKRNRFVHDAYHVLIYKDGDSYAAKPGRFVVTRPPDGNRRDRQSRTDPISDGEIGKVAQAFCDLFTELDDLIIEVLIRREMNAGIHVCLEEPEL